MNPKRHVCGWIISPIGGVSPVRLCQAPATHWCPESDDQYCTQHAEDYAEVFGDDSLKEFHRDELLGENRKLKDRIKRLEEALSRIANQDYRGNRSTESQIAEEALKEGKL